MAVEIRNAKLFAEALIEGDSSGVLRNTKLFAEALIVVRPATNVAVGQATETDSAGAVSAAHSVLLLLVEETDSAGATVALEIHPIGQATETDSAFAITTVEIHPTGGATETDTAWPIHAYNIHLPFTGPLPGLLGCGTYFVQIQQRGGGRSLLEVPFRDLNFTRVLDEVSEASFTVDISGGKNSSCCSVLDRLEPWQHEIAIWWDNREVWVGPVTTVIYSSTDVTVQARDLFTWMDRRLIEQDFVFFQKDLSIVFKAYVQSALSRDPSPNIEILMDHCRVIGNRDNIGATSRQAGDDLRELARTGVDFTMIGRRLIIGGEIMFQGHFGTFTDEAFDELSITKEGLEAATEFTMYGEHGATEENPVMGKAGGVSNQLGLVHLSDTDQTILDEGSAEVAAQNRVRLQNPSPVMVDVTFSADAPVDFDRLRPGIKIPLNAEVGCTRLDKPMRLLDIRIAANDSGKEVITGTLEPIGGPVSI